MVKSGLKKRVKKAFAGYGGTHPDLRLKKITVSERIIRLRKTAMDPDPKKASLREEARKQLAKLNKQNQKWH